MPRTSLQWLELDAERHHSHVLGRRQTVEDPLKLATIVHGSYLIDIPSAPCHTVPRGQ